MRWSQTYRQHYESGAQYDELSRPLNPDEAMLFACTFTALDLTEARLIAYRNGRANGWSRVGDVEPLP